MSENDAEKPDAIDTLLANTNDTSGIHQRRLLDFVRKRFIKLKKEKKELEEKCKDLEHSLEIVQT